MDTPPPLLMVLQSQSTTQPLSTTPVLNLSTMLLLSLLTLLLLSTMVVQFIMQLQFIMHPLLTTSPSLIITSPQSALLTTQKLGALKTPSTPPMRLSTLFSITTKECRLSIRTCSLIPRTVLTA